MVDRYTPELLGINNSESSVRGIRLGKQNPILDGYQNIPMAVRSQSLLILIFQWPWLFVCTRTFIGSRGARVCWSRVPSPEPHTPEPRTQKSPSNWGNLHCHSHSYSNSHLQRIGRGRASRVSHHHHKPLIQIIKLATPRPTATLNEMGIGWESIYDLRELSGFSEPQNTTLTVGASIKQISWSRLFHLMNWNYYEGQP